MNETAVAPASLRPRRAPARRSTTARSAFLLGSLAVLAVAVVASLAIGSRPVAPAQVWAALTGGHVDAADHAAVVDLRLPRTMIGLAVGAALGASGAVIQALTRNPLAEPGVLGVSAGSGFFVAVAVAFLGVTSPVGYLWFALLGALVATMSVFAIGVLGSRRPRPEQLLLAGVALTAVLSGVVSAIRLSDPRRFEMIQVWEAGAIRDRDWDVLLPALPVVVVGVVVALLLGGALNTLALGDDRAAALGSSVVRTRVAAIIAITLLAGAATAMAGPITFVGLMIPHLARWAMGPDQRWIIGLSLVLAPVLLLAADVIARLVVRPGEVPVGIVTAVIGAPALVILIRRAKVSSAP